MSDGSAMEALIRDRDWSATAFGRASTWQSPLRSVLAMCLASPAIIAICWGRDFRLLYNDAYAAVLAQRHPAALGRPFEEVWSEVWDILAANSGK